MGCATGCLKWVLIITNTLFFLAGAATLGLGIWMAVDPDAFDILGITNPDGMEYTVWKATVYTMIGVGAFVFVVAGIGMAGACCKNACLLMTFSVLCGVTLVLALTCAILALIYQDEINAEIAESMYDDLTEEYTTANDTANSYVESWNNFQTMMECCGSYNHTDWWSNDNYGNGAGDTSVPWTCCRMDVISDPPQESDVNNLAKCLEEGRMSAGSSSSFTELYPMGCHESLTIWVEDKSVIIYGVMFGLMGLQILTMTFGCMLYCAYKKGGDYA